MTDEVLERVRVREAAAIFRSTGAAESAVTALLNSGFDRADVDILAGAESIEDRFGETYVPAEDIADEPRVDRGAFLTQEDRMSVSAMTAGILAVIAGGIAILICIRAGSTALQTLTAAVLGGSAVGSIGYFALRNLFERQRSRRIRAQDLVGGLIVWVQIHKADQEERAQRVLKEHGAVAVRVHEIEREKTSRNVLPIP